MSEQKKTTYETILTIDGDFVKTFKKIKLNQEYGKHHDFEVTLGHEAIEERGAHTLEKSRQWIGKKATSREKGMGVLTAHDYMRQNKRPQSIPIVASAE